MHDARAPAMDSPEQRATEGDVESLVSLVLVDLMKLKGSLEKLQRRFLETQLFHPENGGSPHPRDLQLQLRDEKPLGPVYVRISAAGHWTMANDVPKQRPLGEERESSGLGSSRPQGHCLKQW